MVNEAKDAFVVAKVAEQVKHLFGSLAKAKTAVLAYDEDALERKLVQVQELVDKEKSLKKQVKADADALHLATKTMIEGMTDAQVAALLEAKWIQPLIAALHSIPGSIIADLVSQVRALAEKYATTYAELAGQLAETKSSLASLIDELTGNDYDMKGLAEFKALLKGEGYE